MHGAGRCFCAGADISQFGGESQERVDLGRRPTDMLGFEELEMPVVAAIHGYALGGGLEAALGCHYRVIDEDSAVGLPEVNIGLLPGGQGTQRLPRLIGCNAALELMTTGEHVPAPQALEWKVVDESGVGWNSQFCAVGGNLVYGTEQLEVSSQKKQL